jgi:hypothetical protein
VKPKAPKGWRWLKDGDQIEEGDRYFDQNMNSFKLSSFVGKIVGCFILSGILYIRRTTKRGK